MRTRRDPLPRLLPSWLSQASAALGDWPHPTPPRPNQHPSDTPGVFWNTHAFICVDNYPSCTHTQSHTHSFLSYLSLLLCKGGTSCQRELRYWIQTNSSSPPFFIYTTQMSRRLTASTRKLHISEHFWAELLKAFLQFPQSWDGEKKTKKRHPDFYNFLK